MTRSSPNGLMQEIETLLEQERTALIEGRLDDLVSLIARKEELANVLADAPLGGSEALQHLQGKAARNQAMLDSALRGIKSVSMRLSTIRKVRESLESYDENGRRITIETPRAGSLEKRA